MYIEGFWDMLMRLWANGSCHFEGSSSRPSNPREMTFTQLHRIISLTSQVFSNNAVRTPDLAHLL